MGNMLLSLTLKKYINVNNYNLIKNLNNDAKCIR